MADDDRPLTTGDYITRQYKQVRPLLKVLSLFNRNIARHAEELEAQFASVERMKRERAEFIRHFAPLGWMVYDRLSVDIVREVVAEPDRETAERLLAAYHLDANQLQILGYRFYTSRFEAWQALYERAVERVQAQDYLSAVPLMLIIIDGIWTTETGKHPFSEGAEAPVFDSETSGPGGIAGGIAIFRTNRGKLDTTPIHNPYRHGILHGTNPNYGNELVAAKAFNLLQTSIDYLDRRADEEVRLAKAAAEQLQPSWSELAGRIAHSRDMQLRADRWRPRQERANEQIASSTRADELESGSPEETAAAYLAAIVSQNFGQVAKMTIDYPCRPIGFRAGRHRKEMGDLRLTSWKIIGVRDEAAAVSVVTVQVKGASGDRTWSGRQEMRIIYGDAEYGALARGSPEGQWSIMPNFLPNLWATAVRSFQEQQASNQGDVRVS